VQAAASYDVTSTFDTCYQIREAKTGKAPDRNRPPAMPKASDLALRKATRKAKRGAKKRTKPKP
jgi:hypothetical protein